MWMVELKNSKGTRYSYRERFTDPVTGKKIPLSVTMNSKSRHAQRVARQLLQEKYDKRLVAVGAAQKHKKNLLFTAVCDEWQEAIAPTVKIETRHSQDCYCKRIKRGVPDELLFADFTPAMAEKLVSNMYYKEMLSYSYSVTTLVTIKRIMRYAKKAGYIDDVSDFEELTLKRRPATPQELEKRTNKFLNEDERQECFRQLRKMSPRLALAMEFITLTGLRCGELLALRWQDVDINKRQANINGTLLKSARNGEDIQRGTPKNIYSYRTIDLNSRSIAILKWFQVDNKRMELWRPRTNCISRTYKDRGYIFTTRTGAPYNIQFINTKLRQVVIPGKKISTHIFRHTHISMLAEMNVPLKAIMQRVGHNDPNTTLQIYTHVTNAMREDLQKKLEMIQ